MKQRLVILILFSSAAALPAQTCGFSEGKNLTQLQAAVHDRSVPDRVIQRKFELEKHVPMIDPAIPRHPVFLPRWTAETLPFFCKIEHDWARKSRIPLKFRLGSVEYVDWLEGKGH